MRRVLVVDDDPVILDLLEAFLELDGLGIERATNGVEALEALLGRPPDLLLLDLMMPQMDGYALLDAMESDERLAKIPTIIVSAKDQPDAQMRAWRGFVCAYVTKPFNPNALVKLVHQALESPAASGDSDSQVARLKISTETG